MGHGSQLRMGGGGSYNYVLSGCFVHLSGLCRTKNTDAIYMHKANNYVLLVICLPAAACPHLPHPTTATTIHTDNKCFASLVCRGPYQLMRARKLD